MQKNISDLIGQIRRADKHDAQYTLLVDLRNCVRQDRQQATAALNELRALLTAQLYNANRQLLTEILVEIQNPGNNSALQPAA